MNTPKKILITGASGFIGGFLVQEALNRGYEVWAGVRDSSSRENLQDKRIHFIDLQYGNIDKLTFQLNEFRKANGRWKYIIHNAGLTKTTRKELFYQINATYTYNLIEALNRSDCNPDKFLLMSSLSSYGKGDEKGFTPIRLTDPQKPDTAYGKSKLEAEKYIKKQTYFPYIILRPTGVYGPGEKDYFMEIKSINSGLDLAVGTVPQQITFIYVKDLARVAFMGLEKESIYNKEYFVADGDIHTDESFAKLIQQVLGKKNVFHARVPLPLVRVACICSELLGKLTGKRMTLNTDKYIILKQRNWICDITPLQDDLNFQPNYRLQDGLKESIKWYKEHRWL